MQLKYRVVFTRCCQRGRISSYDAIFNIQEFDDGLDVVHLKPGDLKQHSIDTSQDDDDGVDTGVSISILFLYRSDLGNRIPFSITESQWSSPSGHRIFTSKFSSSPSCTCSKLQ